MIELFMQGGIFMWPLVAIAITIVILTVKKAVDLFVIRENNPKRLESGLPAILFWGIISLVIGFLAHYMGMYAAMKAVMQARDISPAIVAGGFAVSLITILFGMLIFLFAAIVWLILKWQYKRIVTS